MEKLLINTPQNVSIEYRLASLGNRFVASLLDYILIVSYLISIYYISSNFLKKDDVWLYYGTVSLLTLPGLFYHLLLETFLGGQTLGKIAMKTKVVKIDGSRASVYEYFTRWILSIIDIWMLGSIIGLVSIILTKKSQRIGDIAANTTVITLRPKLQLIETVYEELQDTYKPRYPEVIKLSDKDMNIIKNSFSKALEDNDFHVMSILSEKIKRVTGIKEIKGSDMGFIKTVIQDHYYYYKDK